MEKDFLPYKQALELKELGFNEPCLDYFANSNPQNSWTISYNSDDLHRPFESVARPTYSAAFRWFREKYGIIHRITSYAFGYQIHLDNTPEPKFWNTDRRFDSDVDYETYEEAELACLEKLIEIVKEK